MDHQQADLLAARGQVFHRFLGRFGARAHHDDDFLGVRGTHVVEQLVLATLRLANLSITF